MVEDNHYKVVLKALAVVQAIIWEHPKVVEKFLDQLIPICLKKMNNLRQDVSDESWKILVDDLSHSSFKCTEYYCKALSSGQPIQ